MANGMANTQPRFNKFIAGHGQMAGKFNALDPAAQAAARQAYKTQGSAAFRGMLNTGPQQQQPSPTYTGLTGGVQPAEIAQDQGAINTQTNEASLDANRVGTVGPTGSVTYGTDANGNPIQTTTLTPEEQAIQEANQAQQGQVYGATGERLDQIAGQGAFGFGQDAANPWSADYSADRQRVEDAVYKRFQSRYEPQFKQQSEDMQQQLANQGIAYSDDPNSQYQRRVREMTQGQEDLRQDAMARAVTAGGEEQQRLFNQTLAGRQQYTGEQLTERDRPLSEAERLAGLQRDANVPEAQAPYTEAIKPADITTPAIAERGARFTKRENKRQRKWQKKQNRLDRQQQERIAALNAKAAIKAAKIAAEASIESARINSGSSNEPPPTFDEGG